MNVCMCMGGGGRWGGGREGVEVEGREETTIDELWPEDGVDNKLPPTLGGVGGRGGGEGGVEGQLVTIDDELMLNVLRCHLTY